MGLFSWDCKHCGHPLIMPCNAESENRWMSQAVALLPNGAVLMGDYDGYGRVAGGEIHDGGEPEVYHAECWICAGSPPRFTEASRNAADQGHFYEEGIHNSPPPGKPGFFHADGIWLKLVNKPADAKPKYVAIYKHRHGADILSFRTTTPFNELDPEKICKALNLEFEPDRGEYMDLYHASDLSFEDIDKGLAEIDPGLYCPSCSMRHTEACMDGGRCTGCERTLHSRSLEEQEDA